MTTHSWVNNPDPDEGGLVCSRCDTYWGSKASCRPCGNEEEGPVSNLPPFPVDDVTLDAIEHALGYCLTYEAEDGTPLNAPRGVGADYSLTTLLDFLAGAMGPDPNAVVIQAGRDESHLPEWERGRDWSAAEIVEDTRPHYSEHDLIRALVAEVRRLREAA